MILFDALYIHNSGGKALLTTLFAQIHKDNHKNFWFLLDDRLDESIVGALTLIQKTILSSSEYQRKKFYKKNGDKFKTIFCFANVPPPIYISPPKKVVIYFQNDLILSAQKTTMSLKDRILLTLKRHYIKIKARENYLWAVQTSLMKKKLAISLDLDNEKIKVFPFFDDLSFKSKKPADKNTFIYVAGPDLHKNHLRLILGFEIAARQISSSLTLSLTLPHDRFYRLKEALKGQATNLNLVNLGILPKNQVIDQYLKHRFCIYPSLKESFGLPLIEAAQLGLKVIAADLDYVHEVIDPSLRFNPYKIEDIATIIIKAVNLKETKKTTLKISNKVEPLLNFISNDI